MTLKTTKSEPSDSVSFSICANDENQLIVVIGMRSESYGVRETKTFELPLEVFSEAIAIYRSDSKNLLDYCLEGIQVKEVQKFFAATAQLQNN